MAKNGTEAEEEEKRQVRFEIMQDATAAVKEAVKARRAHSLMRAIPLENNLHTCDTLCVQRMLPTWIEEFRAQARKTGGTDATCEVLHAPGHWYFSRMNSLVYMRVQ